MAAPAVQVRGLRELERDFRKMSTGIEQDVQWELEEAAEPVRRRSTELILDKLENMQSTDFYAGMRIGTDRKGTVYIVPSWRGMHRGTAGLKRPKLADPAPAKWSEQTYLEKALAENEAQVVQKLEHALDTLAHLYDFY